jgi:hypothetical protein
MNFAARATPSCRLTVARPCRRLLLRFDWRHSFLRLATLYVEPIGIGSLEPLAFDLVAACECLHLSALGLLIPEVDRAKGALAADRAGSRVGLAHSATLQRGHATRPVEERARAKTVRERSPRA